MQVTEMIPLIVFFLMMGTFIVTLVRSGFAAHRRKLVARTQTEMFNRLVDKLGSSQEMLVWLQTDAGQKLFSAPDEGDPAAQQPAAPYSRVLNAVQGGLLLTCVSAGLLMVNQNANWMDSQVRLSLVYVGVIGLAGGIGLLASAAASWWLGKNWGLIRNAKDAQ